MKRYIIAILVIASAGCSRPVRFSGSIKADTSWGKKIVLDGDVYVESGVRLTVLPGTRIYYSSGQLKNQVQHLRDHSGKTYDLFSEDKIEIIVAGDLDVKGTEEYPVLLAAPEKNPQVGGGINFIGAKSSSTVENLIIKGGHIGLRLYNDRAPLLKNIHISGNNVGAIGCWDRSCPEITGVTAVENKYGVGASDMANPDIKDSEFRNNSASGVFFEGQSRGRVANSRIIGNNVGVAIGNESRAQVMNSTISANGSGIGCWDDSAALVKGNSFNSNIVAILVLNRSRPDIERNRFEKNGSGITIADDASGQVYDNSLLNSGPALIVTGRAVPLIRGNHMGGNRYGILAEKESRPRVYGNRFINNRVGMLLTDYAKPEYADNVYEKNLNDTIDSRLKSWK
ncbi:MAG: right-handed parallel beta-helix repeat-containing protein [Elusimicrobia bacterium]|nr:right-handed parallel beta-helix repeat-containing protein [Elusimicrobiota bacterium]